MKTIGVDIGGMSIKIGLVENGKILDKTSFKTVSDATQGIQNIIDCILTLLKNNSLSLSELSGIGIGCPGLVSTDIGLIEILPNIGWQKVYIKEIIERELHVPVKITNDANAATLGEAMYGCAKDYSSCVAYIIGTGVGGGIVINGSIYEGEFGKGAELGHTTLVYNGLECTCGRRGCVETYVSATALINQTKQAMLDDKNTLMWQAVNGDLQSVNGKTAFDCAKLGDKTAENVVNTYLSYLSEAVMNMLNIFRPEAFIIGGGISGEGRYLTDKIIEYVEKFDYGYKNAPKTEILTATLGNNAGIVGAASLFNKKQ